ncbi:MAG: GAF domain-containing protein [Actinobacteria bacterium]|nr:GAF domain-containing protein [Actinomycetota bacterium]
MWTTELHSAGLLGLAGAWESLAGSLAALIVGLAVGTGFRLRAARRHAAAMAEGERERDSMRRIAAELARTSDVEGVARALLDEIAALFGVDFVALTFVSDDGAEASGFLGRQNGEDVDWWPTVRIDIEHEPSGIGTAAREAIGFAVYDVGDSRVSARLVQATGAKSAAYVPLITGERVIAVISAASTVDHRVFSSDDLTVLQALASEATIALERTRSTLALGEALERERLVMSIGRRLRTELDAAEALRAAVEQAGRALGANRCFVRLTQASGVHVVAQWAEAGTGPILDDGTHLPVSDLALRWERTVAVGDVEHSSDLDPQGISALRALGVGSVASTPVRADGSPLGVLTASRSHPSAWTHGDVALLEAVAVEVALALRLGFLIDENRERLGERSALLRAAEVVSGELELPAVLQRLADEVAALLQADASDCYLYDRERGVLRCAAVHGLDPSLVGFEFPADRGLSGLAIREGRALTATEYGSVADEIPHPAYAGFTDAIVAPMRWSDGVRGVLGVGRRRNEVYTARDSDVLEAFAALASLALRNAETFSRSTRQARVQRGFYRIAAVLGESLTRAETLEAVAQAASEALGGAAAAALMPAAGGELVLSGAHNLPDAIVELFSEPISPDGGAVVRAALHGRVIAAPMLGQDERIPQAWRDAATRAGLSCLLSVPVVSPRDGAGGLVAIFFDEPRTFTEDDLELAQHLARAVRGALERSELYEAERGARSLAQQLARTGRLLSRELDPEAILDEVVAQAQDLLHADGCAIRTVESGELVVGAASGVGAGETIGSRSSAEAWLSGDVVQSRSPVALEDAGADARLRELDPMLAAGNTGFLGVPLGGGGVLAVYSTRPRVWREEEIDALLALAASAAGALANAELYQRVALERERSVAILANIADGIVAVDREGTVVLWNEAAEKITGVEAADALGRTPAEVLQRNLESELSTPPGDRLVSIMRGREEVWLSVSEAVMRDPLGVVSGRIFAFRDISADRLVEQMKSDFVSTVSHELRTPLTSIYGFAETLLRQDVLFGDAERTTFLGYIASESQRLTQIVDALLNVARLDTGDLQVHLTHTDVREVVGEAVESVQLGALNDHSFVVELPDEPVAASADPQKLLQVCSILLDNAVRYSPAGGTVRIGAERKGETVELVFADDGIGIPLSDQEQIFRKFYRGTDADARIGTGGTGLGLFIARGLVTAMGGKISVTSREGEGSTFAIELPLAAPVGTAG